MKVSTVNFEGKHLISAVSESSRYLFDPDSGGLLSWQIIMADGNVRDVLFCPETHDMYHVSRPVFNTKAVVDSKMIDLANETLSLKDIVSDSDNIVFTKCGGAKIPYVLEIRYKLSDLFFRVEFSLTNNDEFPIYWRPMYHVFLSVPWCDNAPFGRYVVKFSGKKSWTLSDSLAVIACKKSNDKFLLSELDDAIIGVGELKDNRICVCAPNEEECISLIFGERTSQSIMAFKNHTCQNCLEAIFCSSIQRDAAVKLKNSEFVNCRVVHSGANDLFAVEISAY